MKFPLIWRILLISYILYVLVAVIFGITIYTSQFYYSWIWYGTGFMAILLVLVTISGIYNINFPFEFFINSLIIPITLLIIATVIFLFLPPINILEIADGKAATGDGYVIPHGTVIGEERIAAYIPVIFRGVPALVLSIVIALGGYVFRHLYNSENE